MTAAAVELRGLRKDWDGRPVLRGVDLVLARGERVALVGPNGSGKTTLLRSILGFVRAEGWVRVAGLDPWAQHEAAMRGLAYMPQRAPALAAPVGELVQAWAELRATPVDTLRPIAEDFGLSLDALRTVRFSALSGGMQQKLLAAMALAAAPQVLLLDEPTANLDPAARAVFLGRLAAQTPAPAILLSSHRIDELDDLVDRVVVLDEGAVRFDGPLGQFLAEPGLAAILPFRRAP